MKQYLRDTCVWAFATGIGVGAVLVAGIVAFTTPGDEQIPDCTLPVIRYVNTEVTP